MYLIFWETADNQATMYRTVDGELKPFCAEKDTKEFMTSKPQNK